VTHEMNEPRQLERMINLEELRLSQDFSTDLGVKKVVTTVPVRKPSRQEFVRVHEDEAYSLQTPVLEFKEERETYIVAPELWSEIPGELVPKILLTTISRQGVLALWPIRLPGTDGRLDAWNQSALEAARLARNRWVRVAANMSLGAYDVFEAAGDIPAPEWPDLPFAAILQIAFGNRYITDVNHTMLRRLRGEI
jgi:hypothetical protein